MEFTPLHIKSVFHWYWTIENLKGWSLLNQEHDMPVLCCFSQWSCMDVRVGLWRKLSAEELMFLNCGVGEGSWESLGLQGDPTSPFERKSVLYIHWRDRCWSWSSDTLATWCEERTHLKIPWCWERLKAGGERDDRGWDGWMASPIQWRWVWASSRSWWWTWRPGLLQSVGSQRVRQDWETELNWPEI